jgi:hypothetical protein
MPGVVYTGVAVQFKDKIAEIDAKTQLLQTELLKCITEDGIDPTQTTQSEIKPILENIRQWFT